jgi:hypothetical protein
VPLDPLRQPVAAEFGSPTEPRDRSCCVGFSAFAGSARRTGSRAAQQKSGAIASMGDPNPFQAHHGDSIFVGPVSWKLTTDARRRDIRSDPPPVKLALWPESNHCASACWHDVSRWASRSTR